MATRLFYTPGTCSLGAMSVLEWTGCDYDPVAIDLYGDRTELRAVSAAGQVPVLGMNGNVVTQSVAIIQYLDACFPQKQILPTLLPQRIDAISKMLRLSSYVHAQRRQYFVPFAFTPNKEAQQHLKQAAEGRYFAAMAEVNQWFADEQPLGLQCYVLAFLNWAWVDELPHALLENLIDMAKRISQFESIQRAMKLHKSPLVEALA